MTTSSGHRTCQTRRNYAVSVYPGYVQGSGDAARDFAVLKSENIFADVFPNDYALIDIDNINEDGRLEFYGYGTNDDTGSGGGALRVGAGEVDGVNPHHVNLEAGGARVCDGDSGGPATIYFNQSSPDLLAIGVLSNAPGDDACADSGEVERYSRIGPKMDFVTSKIGHPCPSLVDGRTGRLFRRCFYPPKAFWSKANNKYVQASNAGGGPLIATADAIGQWETFEQLANGDGSTSYVSFANHLLVTAENGGASPLAARATVIGSWEKFWTANLTIDGLTGTSLRANANNRYVAAEDAGASPLIARTDGSPSYWEQFFFNTLPIR